MKISDQFFNILMVKVSGVKQPARERQKEVANSLDCDSTLFGFEKGRRRKVYLNEKSLNTHMLVAGTTGSGKTVTVGNFVESFIKRGLPVIYIDGKGDLELARQIEYYARQHHRPVHIFSMVGDSVCYNPIASGGYTSKKDRLIELREWSEDHYRKLAEGYLQTVFKILDVCNIKTDLLSVADYLDRGKLMKLVRDAVKMIGTDCAERLMQEIEDQQEAEKNIESLKAEIRNLARSEIGHLFDTKNADSVLSLKDVINQKGVAYLALAPLQYPALSDVLGKLIINDLKASLVPENPQKMLLVIDEFTTLAGGQVLNLLNQGRSMGVHAIITVQSLADLGQKIEQNPQMFIEQVLANCNVYLVHRMNSALDAETLAASMGTKNRFEITAQLGQEGATGMGSARRTREFLAHPDDIKNLKLGEAFFIDKPNGVFKELKIRKSEICEV